MLKGFQQSDTSSRGAGSYPCCRMNSRANSGVLSRKHRGNGWSFDVDSPEIYSRKTKCGISQYADVFYWATGTESQRRSTRSACHAGREVRRASGEQTTVLTLAGRSFTVCTPGPPLGGAASGAVFQACSSPCLRGSVAKYVAVFMKLSTQTARYQNSACRRTAKLRGGARAVPEKSPAKSMTLRRSVILSIWT